MQKLRPTQYLGYAFGDAANNLAFSLATSFLLLYYTDVAGIAAGTVGTMFLVVRLWDAVADLLAGRLVDRTSTRWGRFRPWILFGAIPLMLLNVATFTVPSALHGTSGAVIYAYVTYALLGLVYSLVNIPYGSLAPAMTQDGQERAKLGRARVFGTSITVLVISAVIGPRLQGASDLQSTFTITTVAFAVIGIGLYLVTFATAKEQVQRPAGRVGLRESLVAVRRNRPLLVLCASSVLFLSGFSVTLATNAFFARDVLGSGAAIATIALAQTVVGLAAAWFAPRAVARYGKRATYIASTVIYAVGGVALAVLPASLPLVLVSASVISIGFGVINALTWALEADTVEYGEWRTGVRAEGITYAAFSFTRKVGQAFGGAVAGWSLAVIGYTGGAGPKSAEIKAGIAVTAGIVPAVLVLAAGLVMLAYPLTEAAYRRIVDETAARRAAASTLTEA